MNSNKIDFIIFMIISLMISVANNLGESMVICPCQMLIIDQPDKINIKEILDEIIYNWE